MNQQTRIDALTKKVVQKYKKMSQLIGIFLVGSATKNMFDEYSDIDVYILTGDNGKFSREFYRIGHTGIEVLFDTPVDLEKFLADEHGSLYRNTAQMLATSKILFGDEKVLTRFQVRAKDVLASKTTYTDEDILMHKYSIDDFLEDARRDVASNDAFTFAMDSTQAFRHVQELLLKINGEYYRKSREMKQLFKRMEPSLFRLMGCFYESDSLSQKMISLDKIAHCAFAITGGRLPKKWSMKT